MKTRKVVNGIALIICLIFMTTLAMGDHYMKQKRHTDAIEIMNQQQPAEDMIEEIWITEKDRAASGAGIPGGRECRRNLYSSFLRGDETAGCAVQIHRQTTGG